MTVYGGGFWSDVRRDQGRVSVSATRDSPLPHSAPKRRRRPRPPLLPPTRPQTAAGALAHPSYPRGGEGTGGAMAPPESHAGSPRLQRSCSRSPQSVAMAPGEDVPRPVNRHELGWGRTVIG